MAFYFNFFLQLVLLSEAGFFFFFISVCLELLYEGARDAICKVLTQLFKGVLALSG